MPYIIESGNPRAGLRGELGSTGSKDGLKDAKAVAAGTMSVTQAQANWDARAKQLRITLTNEATARNIVMMTGVKKTSAQIAADVEKEIVKRLGARPSGLTLHRPVLPTGVQTGVTLKPAITSGGITFASDPIFPSGGLSNTTLIAAGGAALLLGFLVLRK